MTGVGWMAGAGYWARAGCRAGARWIAGMSWMDGRQDLYIGQELDYCDVLCIRMTLITCVYTPAEAGTAGLS